MFGAARRSPRSALAARRALTGVVLTCALGAGLSPAAGAAGASSARTAAVTHSLVGIWLGPFPNLTKGGKCARGEYLEWFIYRQGSYTSTWNTYPQYRTNGCGGGTAYGRWSVRGDVVTFNQQAVPTCPVCTQQVPIPVIFHFVGRAGNAVNFCDINPSTLCWTYYRQVSQPANMFGR